MSWWRLREWKHPERGESMKLKEETSNKGLPRTKESGLKGKLLQELCPKTSSCSLRETPWGPWWTRASWEDQTTTLWRLTSFLNFTVKSSLICKVQEKTWKTSIIYWTFAWEDQPRVTEMLWSKSTRGEKKRRRKSSDNKETGRNKRERGRRTELLLGRDTEFICY